MKETEDAEILTLDFTVPEGGSSSTEESIEPKKQ